MFRIKITLTAFVVSLLLVVPCWAANITTAAAGDWNTGANWVGGVKPAGGTDRAIIAHDMVVTTTETVGDNAANGTPVVTINAGKSLTINPGGSLTSKGEIDVYGTLQVGTTSGGGTLIIDGVAGAANYPIRAANYPCSIMSSGTATSRSSISSTGSGTTNTWITWNFSGVNGQPHYDFRFTDFTNVGDSSLYAILFHGGFAGEYCRIEDCIFDQCGDVGNSVALADDITWIMERIQFKRSRGTFPMSITNTPAAMTAGVRRTKNVTFDKRGIASSLDWEPVEECYFQFGPLLSYDQDAEALNCFFRTDDNWDDAGTLSPNLTGCVHLHDSNRVNPHFASSPNNNDNNLVFDGGLWEYTGSDSQGDFAAIGPSTNPGSTYEVYRSIFMPNGTRIATCSAWSSTAVSNANRATKWEHNTMFCDGFEYSIKVGESTSGAAGVFSSVKSNLGFAEVGSTYLITHISSNVPANNYFTAVDYNARNSIMAGMYDPFVPSGAFAATPGTHDVTVTSFGFVDATRCLPKFSKHGLGNSASRGTWATATAYAVGDTVEASTTGWWGGSAILYRCTVAHTSNSASGTLGKPGDPATADWRDVEGGCWEFDSLHYIRQASARVYGYNVNATVPAYQTWVRAGFSPTSRAVKDAGHDGVTIGAVEWSGLAFTTAQAGNWNSTTTWTPFLGSPSTIANDDAGYSETGSGWTTSGSAGYQTAGVRYNDAGTGTATASWTKTGLTAGYYTVYTTWVGGSNRATNVPWTIYDSDGTTALASGTLNQENDPAGHSYDSFNWQLLGQVAITGTSLKVTITDNANEYVIADAVLIYPSSTPTYPQDGDTTTLSHDVTITADTTVGSWPGTGGTPAIRFAATKTLSITGDAILTLKGDITSTFGSGVGTVAVATGGITFLPDSGQTYMIRSTGFSSTKLTTAGTSGNHCVIKTDLSNSGLRGTIHSSALDDQAGLITADYTEFTDIELIQTKEYGSAVSIANSLFTRCHYAGSINGDADYVFQNNQFSSSISAADMGYGCGASFATALNGTNGVWEVKNNGFDLAVSLGERRPRLKFKNNVCPSANHLSTSWPDNTSFKDNIFFNVSDMPIYGPVYRTFLFSTYTANPHWCGCYSGSDFDTCVFEPVDGVDGAGDILMYASGFGARTVQRCLVMAKSGQSGGKLIQLGTGAASGSIDCLHNTFVGASEHGLIGLDETSSSYAGIVTSCRSNLVTDTYVIRSAGSGTPAVDSVTLSSHNATFNAPTGTCYYNTSTSQSGVRGYQGIKQSLNQTFPNTAIGTNDFTISSSPFVDSSRTFEKWAQTFGGTDGSYSAAVTYAIAHPVEATAVSTGVLDWVRDGYKVTGSQGALLNGAGHDGSTIGAADYAAAGGGGGPAPYLFPLFLKLDYSKLPKVMRPIETNFSLVP